jgi:hypothetical protein
MQVVGEHGRELAKLIQETSAAIERRWETELGARQTAEIRSALEYLGAALARLGQARIVASRRPIAGPF